MAMEPEEFEALVKRLEGYARAHPGAYRLRVALLAGLGYAYLLLALGGLLLVVALLAITVRSGNVGLITWFVPLLALIGVVLRALWVKMPEPEGVLLKPTDAPQLFATLGEIRARVGAPKAHTVLLNFDFNAAITHRPRLGIFGWAKRYLLLGYPLMQALTPEQFRAVIAHEFGHLSGDHGWFASWIYRIRLTWIQLLNQLKARRRRGAGIFTRFSEWYAPLFNAYSFVLARAHEYEADRAAAVVTSKQIMAESLVAIEMRQHFLAESYWPGLWKRASENREPPPDAVSSAGRELVNPLREEDAVRWLASGFSRKTNYLDTHPALADRIGALGLEPGAFARTASAIPVTAAQNFLGANTGRFVAALDADWKRKVLPKWREMSDHLGAVRKNLAALEEKAQAVALTEEENWTRARLTLELKGNDPAAPLIREILAANPQHVSANYWLGRILLSQINPDGAAYLQRAMDRDPVILATGNRLLSAFYAARGQAAEAQECEKRAAGQEKILAAAEKERQRIAPTDPLELHTLPPEKIALLCEKVGWFAATERAWLVRKKVRFLPQRPFYVLGVLRRGDWFESNPHKKSQELAKLIAKRVQLEGKLLVLVFTRRSKWKKTLQKVSGAEIYGGGKRPHAPA